MSNELGNSTRLLICPADTTKQAAFDFEHLGPNNVSYQVHSGIQSWPSARFIAMFSSATAVCSNCQRPSSVNSRTPVSAGRPSEIIDGFRRMVASNP
jgi:hypothetical protein